jgi:hypothetical protein
MRTLILLPLLAGCAAGANGSTAEDELAAAITGRQAGPPQACVSASGGQTFRVVDSRTIIFRAGDTVWVNRLRSACPGVRPLSTLIVEAHGSEYCSGDHVSGLEPGGLIPGPICLLGDFTPYRR